MAFILTRLTGHRMRLDCFDSNEAKAEALTQWTFIPSLTQNLDSSRFHPETQVGEHFFGREVPAISNQDLATAVVTRARYLLEEGDISPKSRKALAQVVEDYRAYKQALATAA